MTKLTEAQTSVLEHLMSGCVLKYRPGDQITRLVHPQPVYARPSPATDVKALREQAVERVVSVVEEKICVVWAKPSARDEFKSLISAALATSGGGE